VKTKQNFIDGSEMIPLGERENICIGNSIHGSLSFSKDSNVILEKVQLFVIGIKEPIMDIDVKIDDFGASFDIILNNKARAGEYQVVWNTKISGRESNVISKFSISDNIDRTLPIELQHLT